ncbi:helix-turn-helix transcriptional regulator [Flavobacterium urocaniciphilum]|uniref:AraC-type DNA-binding protein n=1 Tax=Flavobacterium urocaniciphilum TaxID=1299341 RepID=A0A1H9CPQ4_9FLAO|nr:helix-turn-helix transcriptional regulator [Flavobacterium urocaniciphilum]SEQ03061.1 AraC-type DNA-binding protein [Flavobacterium urocaniciphilum]
MVKKKLKSKTIYTLIFGLISISSFAQNSIQKLNLDKEVEELMYSNPNQAIIIAQHLLNNPTTSDENKAKVNLLIAKAYLAKGDLSSSLKSLFEEKRLNQYLSISDKAEVELIKSTILRNLYLYKESESEIKNCDLLIQNNKGNITSDATAFLLIEKAKHLMLLEKIDDAINVLEGIKLNANSKSEVKLWKTITLGKLYLEKKNLKLSKENYNQAVQISEQSNPVNLFAKTHALVGLTSIYFLEKNHSKVKELLDESLKNAEILTNISLKRTIVSQQIANYLALNDATNYQLTNKDFNKINHEADVAEEDATNVAYNLLSDEYAADFEEDKSVYYNALYVSIGLFSIVILLGAFYWWRNFQRKKNLDEIIRYLEITRNNLINPVQEKETIVKELNKRIHIPNETEKGILAKLKRFETTTKFTNKDISLAVLAGQFDTNTKYLSEVINANYNMNFNKYINTLRINYLVDKLKSDPNYMNYKISYLAEDCGFASHSSFATVFKSITGISPITFIELLKEEKQAIAI